jgi:TonB family protein
VSAALLRIGGHMSVEPNELTSEVWTRWQGTVINGVFPLGRYIGCSDHSGVFLTKSAVRSPSELAIKLVPTSRALAESQLPRWKRAGGLTHPHLLRLLEWGGCQLDGLPYLYAVMEYADQTLADLLLHRALTEEEAREMLLPALDALTFLHGRNLVQGQLKPANILVVGDQLKLASDTIRRTSDGIGTPTVYDAPETRHGGSSPASDIWALGATLFEALTRRLPSGLGESREPIVLPGDFSPTFPDVVARCLGRNPQDRPAVTELLAWVSGRSTAPAPPIVPEQSTPEPPPPQTPPAQVASEAARPPPSAAQSPRPRAFLPVIVGALVILALGWTGVHVLRTHHVPNAPPAEGRAESGSETSGAGSPAAAEMPPPASAASNKKPGQNELPTSPLAIHEVIPEVPRGARQSIRGHIKVWVRVVVDQDGSVLAAVADRTGSSGYFQRLAIEAAQKWTFAPADTPSRRVVQIRFDFSRDGTTGRAVPVH